MFLVTADTYTGGYGIEVTLFGVFPTKGEAIDFILKEPVKRFRSGMDSNGDDTFDEFDFLKYYESEKIKYIYESQEHPKKLRSRHPMVPVGQRIVPKEEYVLRYITEFKGEPVYIDGYCE